MQRKPDISHSRRPAVAATFMARAFRRLRWVTRFAVQRVNKVRSALSFSGLLALVGVVLFSPLLLDDLALRTSYLLSPSHDAITITEPTLISEQPRLTLLHGTLSVPPALSGKARTGEALAALVKGGNARLALKAPIFQLELAPQPLDDDRTGGLDQALHGLISPMLSAIDEASFETLMIRDATVILKVAPNRDFVLDEVNADVSVKRKSAIRVKGSLRFRGELVNFDTTLGARFGRRGATRMPVKANLQNPYFNASFDGRLEIGGALMLTAASEIAIPNVRTFARWLGHYWPSGPGLKDFSTRGTLEWSQRSVAMQTGLYRLDGNEASGTLLLTLDPERPALAGTLALEAADLNPYLANALQPPQPPASLPEVGTSLMARFKAARDLTLPLAGLLDADVRVSAEQITMGSLQGQGAAASLTLHDGQLLLDVAEVSLAGGGSARGEIVVQGWATTPNYVVRGRLDGVELADVTGGLIGVALLRGRGSVDLDLKASGASGIDVLSKLSGRIGTSMPDGGSAACSIKSIAQAAESSGAEGAPGPCTSSTSFGPLEATSSLTNGILTIDRFDVISGPDQIRLSGGVDLVTRVIDVSATAQPVASQPIADQPFTDLPLTDQPVPTQPAKAGDSRHDVVRVKGRPEALSFASGKTP